MCFLYIIVYIANDTLDIFVFEVVRDGMLNVLIRKRPVLKKGSALPFTLTGEERMDSAGLECLRPWNFGSGE